MKVPGDIRNPENRGESASSFFLRLWQALNRPLRETEASRLSMQVDMECRSPGSSGDAVLAALAHGAGSHPLPPRMVERSWQSLERAIFPHPPPRAPIQVPFRTRGSFSVAALALYRVPRLALAGLGCTAGVLLLAAWRGPSVMADRVVERAADSWSHVADYQGDLQFYCRIPGCQMQWSGTQLYALPDRTRLQLDVMGTPVVMVARGGLGVVESPLGLNQRIVDQFRFLSHALRLDLWVDGLRRSRSSRYEGVDSVLGNRCDVVSFDLGSEASTLGLPLQVRSGRAWISDRLSLPMQVEMYGPDHTLALAFRYTRAAFNVPMNFRLFAPPPPAHARLHIPRSMLRMQFSVGE